LGDEVYRGFLDSDDDLLQLVDKFIEIARYIPDFILGFRRDPRRDGNGNLNSSAIGK
jgi:hypothetical protein